MKHYSLELRQRIMKAVAAGKYGKREMVEQFKVHESYLYKLLRQQRDLNTIAPLPHGGGALLKLTDEHRQTLAEWVNATPDATLGELREGLRKQVRITVSPSTIYRHLNDWN